MGKSTGDLEREAAHALRPIFVTAQKDFGVSPTKAELLMRQLAEAYMAGRAGGVGVAPDEVNRALTAEGIGIALALEYRQTAFALLSS